MSLMFTASHLVCFSSSDAGNSDRVVIQELIKTVAQSQQIQSSTQKEFKGLPVFFHGLTIKLDH